ncbi:uncharacterized protein LOC143368784 [Andrena cerasifolii]|uniref:uncharacterized protein LOC143368784 n=1 Tax=Andrena cerasifolii TaxID=2819439 RepID=UPI00403835C3
MDDTEETISDIYNTLVQIRYPKITTATVKNVELTILKGQNRISLLSWLLCEQSSSIAATLQKLKGPTLEAKLLQYYSEIGICVNKNLLLGNCTLQEQLPTLKLLLDFMKCMFIQPSNAQHISRKAVDDVLQMCIKEDLDTMASDAGSEFSYSESLQYFDNLEKYVLEHQESNSTHCAEKDEHAAEDEAQMTEDRKDINEENDPHLLFNTETKKFIETFSNIGSWPTPNVINANNSLPSMDDDIKSICSNFSSLTKFLQAREGILNATIPKGLDRMTTPLTEIVEDTLIRSEELSNAYKTNL